MLRKWPLRPAARKLLRVVTRENKPKRVVAKGMRPLRGCILEQE